MPIFDAVELPFQCPMKRSGFIVFKRFASSKCCTLAILIATSPPIFFINFSYSTLANSSWWKERIPTISKPKSYRRLDVANALNSPALITTRFPLKNLRYFTNAASSSAVSRSMRRSACFCLPSFAATSRIQSFVLAIPMGMCFNM